MAITVELTYDMGVQLGASRLELEDAPTVASLLPQVRERFGEAAEVFDRLSRVCAIAVNGVVVRHRRGLKTQLSAGDTVAFVKAAAGG